MMSEYVYFTDEQKQRANSVDLVDFLQRQGEKFLPSGREKRLASDHSITVRGSQWYDHAAEEGSHAIDLVKRYCIICLFQKRSVCFLAVSKEWNISNTVKTVRRNRKSHLNSPKPILI